MAQPSKLALLYQKISDSLSDDNIRSLRAMVVRDKILGLAKVQHATPQEIFNMLEDNKTIGEGNLEYLVQVLKSFGKGNLADDAKLLEEEQKMEGKAAAQSLDTMSESHRALLLKNYLTIYHELDATRVMGYLHQQGVLTDGMRQDILAIPEDRRQDRTRRLLDLIPKRGDSAFTIFCSALGQAGYGHLMVLLAGGQQQLMPPMPIAVAIYPSFGQAGRTGIQSVAAIEQTAHRSQPLSDIMEQELRKGSFTVHEKEQILQLKSKMRDEELKALYMYQDNQVKSLERAKAFMSEGSLVTRFDELQAKVEERHAIIVSTYRGCVILFLTFESQPKFEHFWGSYTSGGLSDTLSELLITEEMRRLEEGDQLVIRTLVLMKDYWAWKDFFQKDGHDTQDSLNVLLGELSTATVMGDKAKQFDLYCQLGDLYRTELHSVHAALQYYEKMLSCSEPNTTQRVKAYSRIGVTYAIIGKPQEAFWNHEKALKSHGIKATKDTNIREAYKDLAASLALSGKSSDATTVYEAALSVAMGTGSNAEMMDIYCKLGDLHREQLHEPQVSHKYYTQMLGYARELGRKDGEGLAYNRLGLACNDMKDNRSALEWFQKYLRLQDGDGDKVAEITAHACVGDAYRLLYKLEEAKSHLNKALLLSVLKSNVEYQHAQMKIYLNQGDMHRVQLLSPQASIPYYEMYLKLAQRCMDRHEEKEAYNRLGLAYHEMAEFERALQFKKKYLQISQDDGDKREQVTAHTCLGNTYRFMGELDFALSHFNTAKEMAKQCQYGVIDVNFKMGDMYMEQLHSPRTSIQHYQQALVLAKEAMNTHEEGLACNRLGLAHYDLAEYMAAVEWHRIHLKIRQESGNKTGQMIALENVADAYRALGDLNLARSHYETAWNRAMETGDSRELENIGEKITSLEV